MAGPRNVHLSVLEIEFPFCGCVFCGNPASSEYIRPPLLLDRCPVRHCALGLRGSEIDCVTFPMFYSVGPCVMFLVAFCRILASGKTGGRLFASGG